MAPTSKGFRGGLVAALVLLFEAGSSAQPTDPRGVALPPADREAVATLSCRSDRDTDAVLRARAEAAATGEPLSIIQEPSVLFPAHRGDVRLSEVLVAGDVPTVRFRLNNPTGEDEVETWTRIGTKLVGTRLVSVFSPAWGPDVFQRVLATSAFGVDYPVLYWGSIEVPWEPVRFRAVNLRIAPGALPHSDVTRINDRAQYASHVVNLVIPAFWTMRAEGGVSDVDLIEPAKAFYEHFADVYDILAFVAEPTIYLDGDYNAWHSNARNAVLGVNASVFDNSRIYGSDRVLQGLEVYRDATATTFRLANHELSHQWGHYFDWAQIAGLSRTWPQSVHAPLMYPGQSLIGAQLLPKYRVGRTPDGVFQLERTPAPIEAGPLELYAMGLLSVADLPAMTTFDDQSQFDEGRTALTPGAQITGTHRTVTASDLIRVHGPRTGPVPSTLRRAQVVVSRDGLISQREMDYWNYFSARLEDPNGVGPISYEGYVAFDRATRRAVDLQTRIQPKSRPPIEQAFDVDYPPISEQDCPAVEFSRPVASYRQVGQRFSISGRITATDRTDFNQLAIRFWPYGGDTAKKLMEYADVSASGEFSMEFEFRDSQAGQYLMEVFLFWSGASAQYARCTLTPVSVAPAP